MTDLLALAERLDEAARHGYGAASDWSDRECADYWAHMCQKSRHIAKEVAAAIRAIAEKDNREP